MILEPNNIIISPKQPYFVMAAPHYYKAIVMNYGISHFYCFKKYETNTITAIPDGCIDIVFYCDDNDPKAFVCGTVLHPKEAFSEKNKYFFGVRFLPGSSIKFKNANMSDFVDRQIPFLEVLEDKDLFQKITSSKNFNYQIQVFMDKYLKEYEFPKKRDLKNFLVNKIIESAGQVQVNELADITGYSVRYINKTFNKEFGIPPKVFCKLMRFQYLINDLNAFEKGVFETNLSQLSIELGYYDQAHMIKDFYEFTNTTPMKYIYSLQETEYKKRLVIV
ncbi:MAG: helix-turn-helix domain-containing protein [Bacillota bacterium]|nr:helix-turn-helix domain-containing protein [Bacillota bacterium]